MNKYLKWFRIVVWLGIIMNLFFVIPSLFAPQLLNITFGLGIESNDVWLRNTGMLLLSMCVFYAGAAANPLRYPGYTWLTAVSRLIAAVFWLYMIRVSGYPSLMLRFLLSDLAFGIVLGILLQLGLPAESKLSLANLKRGWARFVQWLKAKLRSKAVWATVIVIALLGGFVGYQLWNRLLRKYPDISYASAEDHWKHGAIGLSNESRIPYLIWKVIPRMFPEKFPGPGGWASFGFIVEEGNELPVGFSLRHIGYPAVEANCALCHTGSYRESPESKPKLIYGGPAHEMDLQRFQRFLFEVATDPRFTPENVLNEIRKTDDLSMMDALVYRYLIIPATIQGLAQQKKEYAWQDLRPPQGRGRVDTFNPTKFNVYHLPDDNSIGTTDLPQVWNQAPRQHLWLHWDGNNNEIVQRNYAAAMAIGARPDTVIPESFKRDTDFLLTLAPPAYPFEINRDQAKRGEEIFKKNCAECHTPEGARFGQVMPEVGTDRHRVDSFTQQLVEKFHTVKFGDVLFTAYRKTDGYVATFVDGLWARAPYLHNGSVPTLWDLLQPAAARTKVFHRGYNVYDPKAMGFVSAGPEAEKSGFRYDTSVPGNSNSGHEFGMTLSDQDKWDLIEFLKTL
ncbi:MAG TPA: c-type cytochrome [Pyrinomonadaceae bacterium]